MPFLIQPFATFLHLQFIFQHFDVVQFVLQLGLDIRYCLLVLFDSLKSLGLGQLLVLLLLQKGLGLLTGLGYLNDGLRGLMLLSLLV